MSSKMILDATTPRGFDRRGDHGEVLDTPAQTDACRRNKLLPLIKAFEEVSTAMATSIFISYLPSMPLRDNKRLRSILSPVAGVWTVFGCNTCFYTWRSTEPEENTQTRQIPGGLPLEPGGFRQYSGSAHHPAVAPKDQMMI